MDEDALMKGITDTADQSGWLWVHIRPGRTKKGWATPIEGPLGHGWVDLVLVHKDRGIRFVEVKGDGGKRSLLQEAVGDALTEAIDAVCRAGISVYDPGRSGAIAVGRKLRYCVWTPREYLDGTIERELRG